MSADPRFMNLTHAEIIVSENGVEILRKTVSSGTYVIGRDEECDVRLDQAKILGRHALLSVSSEGLYLENLGAGARTLVQGVPVSGCCRLWPGQKIDVASLIIEVRRGEEDETSGTNYRQPPASRSPEPCLKEFSPTKKYEIGGVAAVGGMGMILEARETASGRTVALKVLGKSGPGESLNRFISEAKITARLEHPNIVPVHDMDTDGEERFFYTMKFVKGITLHEVLEKLRDGDPDMMADYPLSALLTIFQKVCDAVSFAHSQGIIHRDLKPENIMTGDYGEVLVMDWGLAKEVGVEPVLENSEISEGSASSTMAGQVLGTPQYMSPEQARGETDTLDGRADIYSLGAMLYQILFLRPPVEGKNSGEVIRKVARGEVGSRLHGTVSSPLPHLGGKRPPESLRAVIRKAVAFDPVRRYRAVAELQSDIGACQNGFATSAENAGMARQLMLLVRRHRAVSFTAFSALVIAAVLTTAFLFSVTRERNAAVAAKVAADRERKRAESAVVSLWKTAPDFQALARSLLNEGRPEEALEKIGYAVQLDGNNAGYHLLRAHLLQSSQRLGEAAGEYRRVLELHPGDPSAQGNLALCEKLLALQDHGTALGKEGQKLLLTALREQNRLLEAGPLAAILEPGGDLAEAALRARLSPYRKQLGWRDDRVWKSADGNFGVSLEGLEVGDLSELKGQNISELNLNHTDAQDLRALAGLPLRVLTLNFSQVSDLGPRSGLPLADLEAIGLPVDNLAPLKGMPLKRLVLNRTKVVSLELLSGMPLTALSLENTRIADLSPLRGMPLQSLNIVATHITDLSPLAGLPLQSLDISYNQIGSLDPLAACPQLRRLKLASTRVYDLGPLRGLKLDDLDFTNTNVTDLAPLIGMPLESLRMSKTYVSDLTPLKSMTTLRELVFPPGASGVGVLRGIPLRDLSTTLRNDLPAQTAADFWKEYDAAGGHEGK